MKTISRIAAFGAAAVVAAGVAVGAAGAASAGTAPPAGADFFVQNLDKTHTLVLQEVETGNTAPVPLRDGSEIVPGGTSSKIPVQAIDPTWGYASVELFWQVRDQNGNESELTTLFFVRSDGSTVTQTSVDDPALIVPCQVPNTIPNQNQPGQCDDNAILTFGWQPNAD